MSCERFSRVSIEKSSANCARRVESSHQLHQVALGLVVGANLLDVGAEVLRTTALRVQLPHRLVDQPHRLGVGALVPTRDHVLDVAAIDAERVLGMLGASQVRQFQPQVRGAAALVGGLPGSIRIVLPDQHAHELRAAAAA